MTLPYVAAGIFSRQRQPNGGGGGDPPETTPLLVASPTPTSTGPSSLQLGWRFVVGGASLTAYGARLYMPNASAGQETLRLWRVSDQALLATVAITPAQNAWTEALFSASVDLASGTQYVISTRRTDAGGRNWYFHSRTLGGVSFDARITAQAAHAVNGDGYPGQDSTASVYGLADVLVNT